MGGKDWVEQQVVQVAMLLRTVVGKVDKVFQVVVGADVAQLLKGGRIVGNSIGNNG